MRRNRYFLLLVIVAILLPLLSLSCFSAPATTPASATPADPVVHQSEVTALVTAQVNAALADKASAGSVSALEQRMAQTEGNIRTIQSTPAGGGITQAQLDAAIAALKTDQSWITVSTSSSGGSSGGTTTGTVQFTTVPASIPQLFSSTTAGPQQIYTMHIVNSSNQWQYVKPIVTLSLVSSYSATTVTALSITISSGAGSMSGTIATPNNFSITMSTPTTSSVVIILISGGSTTSGEFQVGAGQSIDILIAIQGMTSATTTLWNFANSISTRSI